MLVCSDSLVSHCLIALNPLSLGCLSRQVCVHVHVWARVCMAKWSWPDIWRAQGSPLQRGCRWTTPAPGSLRPSVASHATLVLSECAAACSHCQKSPWLSWAVAQTCPLLTHSQNHTHTHIVLFPILFSPSLPWRSSRSRFGLWDQAVRGRWVVWPSGISSQAWQRGHCLFDVTFTMISSSASEPGAAYLHYEWDLPPWFPSETQGSDTRHCIFHPFVTFPKQTLVLVTSVWHESGWKKTGTEKNNCKIKIILLCMQQRNVILSQWVHVQQHWHGQSRLMWIACTFFLFSFFPFFLHILIQKSHTYWGIF